MTWSPQDCGHPTQLNYNHAKTYTFLSDRYRSGSTALHWAAISNNLDATKILLAQNASTTVKDTADR